MKTNHFIISAFIFILIIISLASAQMYSVEGDICNNTVVTYTPFSKITYSAGQTPENLSSAYSISLYQNTNLLKQYKFTAVNNTLKENCYVFDFFLDINSTTNKIVIKNSTTTLNTFLISSNSPIVSSIDITSVDNYDNITWVASDSDSSSLFYTLYFSADSINWYLIESNTNETSFLINKNSFAGCSSCKIKVKASDMFNTGELTSIPFSINSKSPSVAITSPANNSYFYNDENISVLGYGYDPEDGELDASSISWYLDNTAIANGKTFTTNQLGLGNHTIKIRVTDSNSNTAYNEIKINIINNSQISYIFNLNKGWNLISMPIEFENSSTESVFSSVMNKTIVINSFEQGAQTYIPSLARFSDLKSINPIQGYWIKLNESANLTIAGTPMTYRRVLLNPGWNLIYYPLDYPKNVPDVLKDINDIVIVTGFDNGATAYIPSIPLKFSTLKQMKPGFSYWIKINESQEEIQNLKF